MQSNERQLLTTMKTSLISTIYPIGAIYITTNSINPGELFGGTWEPFAQGRTIVGTGTVEDKNFVAGTTGGSCTHTLTINELPAHTHTQNPHAHNNTIFINSHNHPTYVCVRNDKAGISNDYGSTGDHVCGQINGTKTWKEWAKTDFSTPEYSISNIAETAVNQNTCDGSPHNNLPPYIVTYIWRRIL